jgi:hypothetical protein
MRLRHLAIPQVPSYLDQLGTIRCWNLSRDLVMETDVELDLGHQVTAGVASYNGADQVVEGGLHVLNCSPSLSIPSAIRYDFSSVHHSMACVCAAACSLARRKLKLKVVSAIRANPVTSDRQATRANVENAQGSVDSPAQEGVHLRGFPQDQAREQTLGGVASGFARLQLGLRPANKRFDSVGACSMPSNRLAAFAITATFSSRRLLRSRTVRVARGSRPFRRAVVSSRVRLQLWRCCIRWKIAPQSGQRTNDCSNRSSLGVESTSVPPGRSTRTASVKKLSTWSSRKCSTTSRANIASNSRSSAGSEFPSPTRMPLKPFRLASRPLVAVAVSADSSKPTHSNPSSSRRSIRWPGPAPTSATRHGGVNPASSRAKRMTGGPKRFAKNVSSPRASVHQAQNRAILSGLQLTRCGPVSTARGRYRNRSMNSFRKQLVEHQ